MNFKLMMAFWLGLYQVTGQRLVCEPVQGVCSPVETSLPTTSDAIDGKLQPVVNFLNIIKEVFGTNIQNLNSQMETVKTEVAELKRSIGYFINGTRIPLFQTIGMCDVFYNNTCFWAIVHDVQDIDYAEAERLCDDRMARVADVYNKEHFLLLEANMREKALVSKFGSRLWFGMNFDPATRKVTTKTGSEAHVVWMRSWPLTGPLRTTWTKVGIAIDRASSSQGMYNQPLSTRMHGVVCEI